MTTFEEFAVGDPVSRPPWPYAIQVVLAVIHTVQGYHCDHSQCRLILRDRDGERWEIQGSELTAGGWFRLALTTDAAEAIGCTPAKVYVERAVRWVRTYNPKQFKPEWLLALERDPDAEIARLQRDGKVA